MAIERLEAQGAKTTVQFGGISFDVATPKSARYAHVPSVGIEFPDTVSDKDRIALMDVITDYFRKKNIRTVSSSPGPVIKPRADDEQVTTTYYAILSQGAYPGLSHPPAPTPEAVGEMRDTVLELFTQVAPQAVKERSDIGSAIAQLSRHIKGPVQEAAGTKAPVAPEENGIPG